MSYRHDQARKGRRAKTGKEHRHLIVRDTAFCDRWGIAEEDAWKFNRRCDHTIKESRR